MTTATATDTVQAIRNHHERLGRTVADHTVTIARAVDRLASPAARRDLFAAFLAEEVVPHAAAEEETLYRAALDLPEAALLVKAMTDEHAVLRKAIESLREAGTPSEIVAAAAAVNALFQAHLEKENELLLPALVDAGVDIAALLEGMHDILGEPAAADDHHCTCGGHDDPGDPDARAEVDGGELDVRTLVPAQRHRQIFAAFDALAAGGSFVLVNDHDPKPLRYQFAAEHPGGFTWDYLEAGPRVWRVRIGRP